MVGIAPLILLYYTSSDYFCPCIKTLFITAMTAMTAARTCDDNGEIRFTRNPKPILSQKLMPGFKLESSEIIQDKKTNEIIIAEYWNSTDGNNVKFDIYLCKSYKDALATAEKIFYATMVDDQEPGGSASVLGSFSGQTIGDVCWTFKDSGPPEEKTDNSSRSLLFIKGKSLVSLLIFNNVTKFVSVNFAEDVAKKIVSRIK